MNPRRIGKRKLLEIQHYVLAIVSDQVRIFIGTEGRKNRGENWTAERHIEWIKSYCERQAELNLLCPKDQMWYVRLCASEEANKWLTILQEC